MGWAITANYSKVAGASKVYVLLSLGKVKISGFIVSVYAIVLKLCTGYELIFYAIT